MTGLQLIFWISVGLLIHSYFLFSFILSLLTQNKKQNEIVYSENEYPDVKIIMAVYNEEKLIAQKLQSIFNTSYPKEKITVCIGSDASDDQTEKIILKITKEFPSVHLKRFESRTGKPAIINQLIKENTSAENILLLTDANVIFTENMIGELVKHFKNEKIALVGAFVQNVISADIESTQQEKMYIQRENHIKYNEGKLAGVVMGAFGGCFAIRQNKYAEVPDRFIADDFYICMMVLLNKGKAIMEPNALCTEDLPGSDKIEFDRKKRISTGNFQNLAAFSRVLLNPFSALGFCFWSHKVLRWLGPFFLLIAFFSSGILFIQNQFYIYLFLSQAIPLLLVMLHQCLAWLGLELKPLRFIAYFYKMNLALMLGFFYWIKGVKSNTWTPTVRN